MKRIIAVLLTMLSLCALLSACAQEDSASAPRPSAVAADPSSQPEETAPAEAEENQTAEEESSGA